MAQRERVSAVPQSRGGRWQSRSEQVEVLHDSKEDADAFHRLKAQGQAVADQALLDALAAKAQADADLAAQILGQQGSSGGDGGGAGAAGGGGSGAGGSGSSDSGADAGTGGGSDGGSGSGGSGDGPGGAAGDP